MAHPNNAKLGFVEGIKVVDGEDGSLRTVTLITVNVRRELGKRMYNRSVIILTVEEWDALQAERDELYKRLSRIRTATHAVDSAIAMIYKELNLSDIKEADDGTV